MLIEVLSYTGNGTSQEIPVDSGTPDVVIIKGPARHAVFKTAAMSGDITLYLQKPTNNFDAITRTPSGFSVNDRAIVNASGETYYVLALKANADADLAWGSYVGNGVDDRDITGLGFQPDVVVIKADEATTGCWKTDQQTGEGTFTFGDNSIDTVNQIQALLSGGFQVGTSNAVNASSVTYWWFAFKKASGRAATGLYSGNGVDDRQISVGWRPRLMWLKSYDAYYALLRFEAEPADECLPFVNEAALADAIQSFGDTYFEVGTNDAANRSGSTHCYLVFNEILTAEASLPCYLEGVSSYLEASQPAYVVAADSITAGQPCYAAAPASTPISAGQPAYTAGVQPLSGSLPAYGGPGYDPTAFGLEGALAAYLQGLALLSGAQPAFLEAALPPHVSAGQVAYLAGFCPKEASQPVFCRGREALTAAVAAWVEGGVFTPLTGAQACFATGQSIGTLSRSLPAFVAAGVPAGQIGFLAAGAMLPFSVGRVYPVREPRERLQIVSRTAAGSLRVTDKGFSAVGTIRLAFRSLPAADYQALIDWYDNVAVGALNAFTFVDEAGASHQVRWMGGLNLEQTAPGRWAGEIVLEKVA